jgi:hypothetical protein
MHRSEIDCEKWIAEGRGRAGEGAPSQLTPNHKLESTKDPVDVLVIDHVEYPTAD